MKPDTPAGWDVSSNKEAYLSALETARQLAGSVSAEAGFRELIDHVDAGKRGQGSAYFSRELGFPVETLADWYYGPGAQKAEFLGLAVIDPNRAVVANDPFRGLYVLTQEQEKIAFRAEKTLSGYATLKSLDPAIPHLPQGTVAVVEPKDIWLNRQQKFTLEYTEQEAFRVRQDCWKLLGALLETGQRIEWNAWGGTSYKKQNAMKLVPEGQAEYRHIQMTCALTSERVYREAVDCDVRPSIPEIERSFDLIKNRIGKLWGEFSIER